MIKKSTIISNDQIIEKEKFGSKLRFFTILTPAKLGLGVQTAFLGFPLRELPVPQMSPLCVSFWLYFDLQTTISPALLGNTCNIEGEGKPKGCT